MLSCFEIDGDRFFCPRGFFPALVKIAGDHGEECQVVNNTRVLEPVSFKFGGVLRDYQKEACHDIFKRDMGVLCAPTGSGKTIMALATVAERKQPSLIVCHTKELLYQWADRIQDFLGIEPGMIGNGKKQIGASPVPVAMVQTLYKCASEVSPFVGHLIIDECHRTPSRTFTEAATAFDAKYILGLSATPYRRDKLSKLIFWHLGPKAHEVKKEHLIESGAIMDFEVITRETDFVTCLAPSTEYSQLLSELCQDSSRNNLICSDMAREAFTGKGTGVPVLTDRKGTVMP
jgi:superfamily II DNA or RNA helicase